VGPQHYLGHHDHLAAHVTSSAPPIATHSVSERGFLVIRWAWIEHTQKDRFGAVLLNTVCGPSTANVALETYDAPPALPGDARPSRGVYRAAWVRSAGLAVFPTQPRGAVHGPGAMSSTLSPRGWAGPIGKYTLRAESPLPRTMATSAQLRRARPGDGCRRPVGPHGGSRSAVARRPTRGRVGGAA